METKLTKWLTSSHIYTYQSLPSTYLQCPDQGWMVKKHRRVLVDSGYPGNSVPEAIIKGLAMASAFLALDNLLEL